MKLPGPCVDPTSDATNRYLAREKAINAQLERDAQRIAKKLKRPPPWTPSASDAEEIRKLLVSGPEGGSEFDLDGDGIRDLEVHFHICWTCPHDVYVMRGACGHWVGTVEGSSLELQAPKRGLAEVWLPDQDMYACDAGLRKYVFDGRQYRLTYKKLSTAYCGP